MITAWAAIPADNRGRTIDILPPTFDTEESNCVMCGGTLDTGWECNRCGADHFPAVKRLIAQKETEL